MILNYILYKFTARQAANRPRVHIPPPRLPACLMQTRRMEVCSRLWRAGIKAEFGFKPNPKMGDQLGYALEQVG